MAAAFFTSLADPSKAQAVSAGTEPADAVHPTVIEAMREVGIDLRSNKPQRLTDNLARRASLLVTMGCGESCPYVPGLERDDWALADPNGKSLADVRKIRDEIRQRVARLIDARAWRAPDGQRA